MEELLLYCVLIGNVMDKNGDLQYQFDGDWMSHLNAKPAEGKIVFFSRKKTVVKYCSSGLLNKKSKSRRM